MLTPELQSQWEMDGLVHLLNQYDVNSMLEIGTRHGDTAAFLANKCALKKVVMVDYAPAPRTNDRIREMRKMGVDTKLIVADSHDQATVDAAQEHAPFDLVFIDADHTYEGARWDWLKYGPMGRIVALHDIAGDNRGPAFEVGKLWSAIKLSHRPSFEIIEPGGEMGIGVIWNGDG